MWIITVYTERNTTMYEFDTEKEAKAALEKIEDCKILSEIIYYNDAVLA
ncbi:hypothetical protein J7J00_21910 [Bacillus sp. ISL-4]|nr:hypothetical protein [Bacillus sp. ISL-4]MBT2668102.1 hypothetical protein [Bacillus sp. ISL-4]MBT2673658.1 hypothetical protein [Streptomyces sp. ISL-14]